MHMHGIQMTTVVKKDELLRKLEKNLAEHSAIVKEAREGYLKRARRALDAKLEEIRSGKIVSLSFNLRPPLDYSSVYKTTIQMLKWNTAERVHLGADEFRQLVEDQWDWTRDFYSSSLAYSARASEKMAEMSPDDE